MDKTYAVTTHDFAAWSCVAIIMQLQQTRCGTLSSGKL